MLVCEHDARLGGWAAPRIVPFPHGAAATEAASSSPHPQHHHLLPGATSPALQALHYGASCFEGMKAYASPEGPRLFRPDLNAARFARSAARLGLAPWSPKELVSCLAALLDKDAAWLPDAPGHAMYLRPFAYASESGLGVHRTSRTAVAVVMSPVGPYFKTGAAPVSLLLDRARVRAWPGGTGSYKIAGNYAPTVVPQAEAASAHGCAQVLYTMPAAALLSEQGAEGALGSASGSGSAAGGLALPEGLRLSDRVVGECGAMNVFFVLEHNRDGRQPGGAWIELATPPLDDGTILPGVTRRSALELARAWAAADEEAAKAGGGGGSADGRPPLRVRERHVTVRELVEAASSGALREVFGTGTACVVQPVAELVLEEGAGGAAGGDGKAPAVRRLVAPGSAAPAPPSSPSSSSNPAADLPLWARLGAALADIQYGRVPGGHPWSVRAADLIG